MTSPVTRSLTKKIRVRKEDSAYVYFILESYEGVTSYTTLASTTGDAHRDLELRYTPDFKDDVEDILRGLGEMVYEIKD